jgi:hypothetical protein
VLLLLFLFHGNAAANIHGVETVRVIAADEPPAYDLDQIEDEVTDTIRRTKRNLWVRVAVLEIDPLGSTSNDCGSGNPLLAGVELLCEVGNAVEETARRAQVNQAINTATRTHVESDAELAPDLSVNIDKLLSSNLLQLRLATAVEDFVVDHTGIDVVGGGSAAVPGHRITTNLLRVEAVSNKIDSRVAIRLHGEAVLVNNRDGAIVDKYFYAVETSKHFIEGWSQGGIGLLAASFAEGITTMAEVLAEEVLLVVTSPRQRRKGYLVVPVAPKYKISLRNNHFIGIGVEYRPTDTLQPAFAWEDFRDAYAKDPLYADAAASELEVSYDIRIYRSRLAGNANPLLFPRPPEMPILLIAGEMLHEFRGISGEEFTPNITFEHCTPYAWTIRARFVVDGKKHLTYWSGDYKEKKVEQLRQYRISEQASVRTARSIGMTMGWNLNEMWREEAQYFPFLATSPEHKCSTEEVIAAMAKKSP